MVRSHTVCCCNIARKKKEHQTIKNGEFRSVAATTNPMHANTGYMRKLHFDKNADGKVACTKPPQSCSFENLNALTFPCARPISTSAACRRCAIAWAVRARCLRRASHEMVGIRLSLPSRSVHPHGIVGLFVITVNLHRKLGRGRGGGGLGRGGGGVKQTTNKRESLLRKLTAFVPHKKIPLLLCVLSCPLILLHVPTYDISRKLSKRLGMSLRLKNKKIVTSVWVCELLTVPPRSF